MKWKWSKKGEGEGDGGNWPMTTSAEKWGNKSEVCGGHCWWRRLAEEICKWEWEKSRWNDGVGEQN